MEWQPFIAAGIGLIVTIVTWFLNEQSKRADNLYQEKETHYAELVRWLNALHLDSLNAGDKPMSRDELVDHFVSELNICWLYCTDDVIRKAYAFLLALSSSEDHTMHSALEKATGDLILAIRRDLDRNSFNKVGRMWAKQRTRLTPDDFMHL